MLIRNADGKLQIINRNDCKNESDYNLKLYLVRLEYMQKYKCIIFHNSNHVTVETYQMPKLLSSL